MRDLAYIENSRMRDYEKKVYGTNGNGGNGVFHITAGHRSFLCIASDGGGWDHVSVTPWNKSGKTPTWNEMCEIKDIFFGEDERVVQFHPPKAEYVNDVDNCLHLWRPNDREMPHPPMLFV